MICEVKELEMLRDFMDLPRDVDFAICPNCRGKKANPRNRKQLCPTCGGTGDIRVCKKCGEKIPCKCDQGVLY